MFFVCMDIARSFDTVPLRTLLRRVVPDVLRHEQYVVLRYAVVKRNISNAQLLCRICSYVCEEPGEEAHFPRLVRNKLGARHRGALFIDLASVTVIQRSDLLAALNEVLSNNIVTVPRRVRRRSSTAYAVQCQGLPQGSPLSSIFTSLFYGFVERSDLSDFLDAAAKGGDRRVTVSPPASQGELDQTPPPPPPPRLFMRQIDDTLFASASDEVSRRLAQRMTRGWDDTHGFVINPSKTRSNFDAGVGGKTSMRLIPWCGYIFDTETLEVRGDYDRYVSSDCRIRDTLSIVHGAGAMESFKRKASTCFRPKLHALLLDGNINSKHTILLNIYQATLLSALKLCSYAAALLPRRQAGADPNTPAHFRRIVDAMVDMFQTLVHLAVTSAVATRSGCTFPVGRADVKYLVHRGFRDVLRRRMVHVWFVGAALDALEGRVGSMRFTSARGGVVDLEVACAPVVRPAASTALWSLKL
jgi:telomerase reverse transcriptase